MGGNGFQKLERAATLGDPPADKRAYFPLTIHLLPVVPLAAESNWYPEAKRASWCHQDRATLGAGSRVGEGGDRIMTGQGKRSSPVFVSPTREH